MAGSSGNLHEPRELLDEGTIDAHRAIVSIMEEFEAIDWYDQRAAAAHDSELKRILMHNRDEEKEHAIMTLEWLRRRDPALSEHLRTYLFTEGPITEIEAKSEITGEPGRASAEASGRHGTRSLGIGSLLGRA